MIKHKFRYQRNDTIPNDIKTLQNIRKYHLLLLHYEGKVNSFCIENLLHETAKPLLSSSSWRPILWCSTGWFCLPACRTSASSTTRSGQSYSREDQYNYIYLFQQFKYFLASVCLSITNMVERDSQCVLILPRVPRHTPSYQKTILSVLVSVAQRPRVHLVSMTSSLPYPPPLADLTH